MRFAERWVRPFDILRYMNYELFGTTLSGIELSEYLIIIFI